MWMRIADRDSHGALAVGLADLLAVIVPDSGYVWAILDVEMRSDSPVLGKGVLEIEQQVAESPHGLVLSWLELNEMARTVDEFVDLCVVACKGEASIPSRCDVASLEATVEIALELVDSNSWDVFVRNDQFAIAFEHSFPNSRRIASP
jgi:hypothetical protein